MITDITNLMRPSVKDISPYEPGKPIEEVRREHGLDDVIKMASNENPLGPSPLAVSAMREEINRVNRYPDGSGYYLKKKLSAFLGVNEEQLILGNGSDEIIRMVVETFLNDGEEAIVSEPSFIVYPSAVRIMNGTLKFVGMKNFSYDSNEILNLVSGRTKLIFFANPNNPTGTILSRDEADRLVNALPDNVITVFDEAYFEYVQDTGFPDSLAYINRNLPVVCLRTFSKIYGLAGLRIGYGITREEIAEGMNRVRQPFNVNSVAQKAAIAALDDKEHVEKSRELNRRGKKYLYSQLDRRNIEYVPTEANFILIRAGRGAAEKLLKKGVIVRGMDCYRMPEYIRVTVGLDEENERFVKAVDEVLT